MGLPTAAAAAPSVRLPPICQIHEQPIEVLANEVDYLHHIYNPPVRGARRIDRKTSKDVLHPGAHVDENALLLETLRTDEFERAYAVRWLTALVSHASLLLPPSPPEDDGTPFDGEEKLDPLVRAATSLIAIYAGTTAARTLARRYAFYVPSLRTDVEIALTDVPISTDSGYYPSVGTQTWGSACLMAEMLVEEPEKFGLWSQRGGHLDPDSDLGEVRILELGAGTGLVSLAAAKLLSMRAARAMVVASDYHPAVLGNLEQNIRANFPPGAGALPPGLSLSAHGLDWSAYSCAPPSRASVEVEVEPPRGAAAPPFDRPFDVILGADVVYEPSHTMWIRDTVAALLPRQSYPTQSRTPRFHLVMPLRPTHASESRMVEETFPSAAPGGARPELALCVLEKETIVCEAEDARGSEVEYVYYVIGWA